MDIRKYLQELGELERKSGDFLHLTTNENKMSESVRKMLSTNLSERYYFGGGNDDMVDLGGTTFVGLKEAQDLIKYAEETVKVTTGGVAVNMKPLSGLHSMMCSILATTEPEDAVMSVRGEDGGHFATRSILSRIGRKQVFASYDSDHLAFDIEKTAQDFKTSGAKLLYLDISDHIKPVDVYSLRQALGNDAVMIYDASHTLGLIMGGAFPNPLKEGANLISANTHKTLPGPQKGLIVFRDADFGEKVSASINSLISSSHTHHLLALAVAIAEMAVFGHDYARQIIANSNALASAFVDLGHDVRRADEKRFSYNHQTHVFLDREVEKLHLYNRLVKNNISTNFKNTLGGQFF